jgi:hypothetical protein
LWNEIEINKQFDMEKEKTFEEIKRERMMLTLRRMCYWLCAIGSLWVSPAVALFMGIALALTIGAPYAKSNKKVSKYLLQAAVVGLGFGMNLHSSLAAGREGMMFTIVSVVGVMIVGVGMPVPSQRLSAIQDCYERHFGAGFDYAFRIPGMQKVLQAAGRVIRSETDRGVVVLMDERYHQPGYAALLPAEWQITEEKISKAVRQLEACE